MYIYEPECVRTKAEYFMCLNSLCENELTEEAE